jgi:hypothetical protein
MIVSVIFAHNQTDQAALGADFISLGGSNLCTCSSHQVDPIKVSITAQLASVVQHYQQRTGGAGHKRSSVHKDMYIVNT